MTDTGSRKRDARERAGVTVLRVPSMDCVSCARRISDGLERTNGVAKVVPSVVSRDVRVEFDEDRVTRDAIVGVIRDLGYAIDGTGESGRRDVEPRSIWSEPFARRAYLSGGLIAIGLVLRAIGASPTLVTEPWPLDAGGALFIIAALIGGYNFFPKGLRAARRLQLDMNFLMTAAIFGALAIGEHFEAAMIAFLFGIAELLESHAIERARRSIESLLGMAPTTARMRRGDGEAIVPVEEVEPGDIVLIRPGEKVPIDGLVTDGISAVDQSPITGESLPVTKIEGDPLYAGTIVRDGYLEIRVSKRADDTTLAHIIQLVEEAEAARAPSERFVDRFARYYTPAVTILAVAVMVIPPLALGGPFETWFLRGLTLLVISCPCALVISTPVAVVSALTSAARNGVLIKGGAHLEAMAGVKAVAFDKTGTLTAGALEVVDVIAADGVERDDVLRFAVALEKRSEHPIANAIRHSAAARDGVGALAITDFQALPGRGVRARINDTIYQVGNPDLFGSSSDAFRDALERAESAGQTAVYVGKESRVLGLIALRDREREWARRAVEELKRLGVERVVMLTGDSERSAAPIADAIGVDEWHAGLLPDQKVEKVRGLEARWGSIAMVGDGVNDAPALAAATVGIAMGAAGSDVALETADVALMGDDLSRLPYLFKLARRSGSVIHQNIAASIAIKLTLAAGTLPGLVSLVVAVLAGDLGASLAVIGNALRLARVR